MRTIGNSHKNHVLWARTAGNGSKTVILWVQIVGNEGKNPFFMLRTAKYGVFSTVFDVLTARFAFQRHEKQAYNRRITHASSPKCELLGVATAVIGVKNALSYDFTLFPY